MSIRIMIAEDNKMLLESIHKVLKKLSNEFEVVATAENGQLAVNKALSYYPDVILMDIDMPLLSGIGATKKILEVLPDIAIISFSLRTEYSCLEEMRLAGARGFVAKHADLKELKQAIESVAHGLTYYCPELKQLLG